MVCRCIPPPVYRLLQGVCIRPKTGWIEPSALPVSALDVVRGAEDPPSGPEALPDTEAMRLCIVIRMARGLHSYGSSGPRGSPRAADNRYLVPGGHGDTDALLVELLPDPLEPLVV